VKNVECRVQDLKLRVRGLESGVLGLRFTLDVPGFRVREAGCMVSDFGERISGFCPRWSTE